MLIKNGRICKNILLRYNSSILFFFNLDETSGQKRQDHEILYYRRTGKLSEALLPAAAGAVCSG
jgi:hypothetical protein